MCRDFNGIDMAVAWQGMPYCSRCLRDHRQCIQHVAEDWVGVTASGHLNSRRVQELQTAQISILEKAKGLSVKSHVLHICHYVLNVLFTAIACNYVDFLP